MTDVRLAYHPEGGRTLTDLRLAYNPGPVNAYKALGSPTVRLALGNSPPERGGTSGLEAPSVRLACPLKSQTGANSADHLAEQIPAGRTDWDKLALLVSYVYLDPFLKNRHRYAYRDWVLDSGAFSAHNSGTEIKLEAYMATCRELMAAAEIHARAVELMTGETAESVDTPDNAWMVLTGGEPALQVDHEFVDLMHEWGWKLAIETNGSIELPDGIDWITVSPKVPEHAIRQRIAHEVKYVIAHDQPIPETTVQADHYLLSPVFYGTAVSHRALEWCIRLVKENPAWSLSVQQHKAWDVR